MMLAIIKARNASAVRADGPSNRRDDNPAPSAHPHDVDSPSLAQPPLPPDEVLPPPVAPATPATPSAEVPPLPPDEVLSPPAVPATPATHPVEVPPPPIASAVHDHEALQLSRALQPQFDAHGCELSKKGSSQYLWVQREKKSGKFRAVVSHRGHKYDLGLSICELAAAIKVRDFLATAAADPAVVPPKASNRMDNNTAALIAKVEQHNLTAITQGKHFIVNTALKPKCLHCDVSVHRHYVPKFMNKLCVASTTDKVDKRGSITRGTALSATRAAPFIALLKEHNATADAAGMHVMRTDGDLALPVCIRCGASRIRNYVPRWMKQTCPAQHSAAHSSPALPAQPRPPNQPSNSSSSGLSRPAHLTCPPDALSPACPAQPTLLNPPSSSSSSSPTSAHPASSQNTPAQPKRMRIHNKTNTHLSHSAHHSNK
jgi:hypothetical protein